MSVQTTADEKRDLLVEKLKQTKQLLIECVELIDAIFDKDTWGSDEWGESFKNDTETLDDDLRHNRTIIRQYLNLHK